MPGRLSPNMFKAGDTLKAADLQALVDAVRKNLSLPSAFQNGAMVLQAPQVAPALPGNIILAKVSTEYGVAATDEEFEFTDGKAIMGRGVKSGTAKNIWKDSFEDEDLVILFQLQENREWIPAETADQIIQFELLENKTYLDVAALAVEIQDGDPVGGDVYVLDPMHIHYGLGYPTDSDDSTVGYRGFGLKVYDDYMSSGKPAYLIITMENPAHFAIATLLENYVEDGTKCSISSDDIIFGSPTRPRPPFKTVDDDDLSDGQIRVHDDLGLANYIRARSGDDWLIAFDESGEHYIFILPLHELKLRYKGTGTVDPTMGSVNLTDPTALVGPTITGTVTVTNNPKLLNDGDPIFAVRDRTASDLFTTADMGNFLPALKGLKEWDEEGRPRCLSRTEDEKLIWEMLDELLVMMTGFDSGEEQVITHNGTKAIWGPSPEGGGSLDAGCGIIIEDDEIRVDISTIAGDGLEPEFGDGACQLKVKTGCGLTTASGSVVVNRSDLVGPGLEAGAGTCNIRAKLGCGLTFDVSNNIIIYPPDIIGDYLEPQPGGDGICNKMKVTTETVTVIKSIESLTCTVVGDEFRVKLSYKTQNLRVIEVIDEPEDGEAEGFVDLFDCEAAGES